MLVDLVTVRTADGVDLDGGLQLPPPGAPSSDVQVLLVHGLTTNFYQGPSRWLAPLLARAGHPCLSLNSRDHDMSEPKDFEFDHHDLRAGIDYLTGRGAGDIAIFGHGFGCNRIACYSKHGGDERPFKYILASFGAAKAYRPDIWAAVLDGAPSMRGRVLIVQGAADEKIQGRERAEELRRAATGARVEVVLLEGANHYFDHRQRDLADRVGRWLRD
jgi:alpha-beta hydrolase superfamily lysophospholipase